MIRRTIAAGAATSVAAALLVPWGVAANAADVDPGALKSAEASLAESLEKGPVLELGTGSAADIYFVQLDAPAVPRRAVAVERGLTAASSESGYRKELRSEQADLVTSISRVAGGAEVINRYTEALNGVAVRMTRSQARKVAEIDGVTAVQVDFERELTTDRGPEWIGAPEIWEGTEVPAGFEGNRGEGVVVGILDSGINPDNPSFADVVPAGQGGDGYDHTNPLGAGTYLGMCDPDNEDQYVADWGCNDKLIGYYNLEDPEDGGDPLDDPYDDDGHGSHTASTTAGNQVEATAYAAKGTDNEFSVTSTIKGVAPHANIIGYDVCDGGCQGYSIVTSIEQAIIDGVDVINYSIGSSAASNPWTDLDAVGFLNARAAGIHVATSAGNDGPGAATLGSPGDVPWMTTVGATTHDRTYVSSVTDIVADDAQRFPDIAGAGLSGPTDGSYPVVDAAAAPYANALCGQPGDSEEAGAFPAGTDLTGKIVICERGGNGRVEKGENLAELNAAGMILVNNAASGDSLNGDAHALPAAHLSYDDGVALRAFMAAHAGTEAALSGSVKNVADANGDIMAAFSSRGPNRAVSSISPSVSAPGVDILAAAGTDNDVVWEFISGTSMASPHTAGALALLKGMQLELPAAQQWTPAEAQSALMTTSERDITDSDGTAADWFDMGSGRIELRNAAKAGVVLDETQAGYEAADPAVGGDVRDLNTASMADDECLRSCEWTRTFTGTATGVGTWDVSVENLSDGITLETDVDTVAVTDGGNVDVTVTATIADGTPTGEWLFGTLVLTPPAGSTAPVAHLPVGVLPPSGVLPTSIDITTRRDAGSQVDTDLQAIAIDDLQIDASGLVPEDRVELTVVEDTTNTNPYDGNGTKVEMIEVPAGATNLIVKLENPTAPDFDLYVGKGAVSAANQLAFSASAGSNESLSIANPEPGTYWVLVQNWQASPGDVDTTDLVTAVVAGDQGNLRAEGPSGAVPAAEPFDIRTFWDEDRMEAGQTWHGTLTLGTSAQTPGDIGVIPVVVDRIADDVTKTADVTTAAPGDVITYTVDVAPNVAREDLAYTITDPLPAGTTYVEGSATNGATFAGGTVTWTGTAEAPSQDDEAYSITTSATDASCVNPLTGDAEYFDLQSNLGITRQPGVTGDGKVFTTGTGYQYGLYEGFQPGVSFSDDGFLLFGGAGNYGTSPGVTQSVPDVAAPNNVLAMLWQDMVFTHDNAAGAGVSIASDGAGFYIVEFDKMRRKSDPTGAQGTYDYQVFAEAGSNDYVVAYDNLTGPLTGVTIGTENASGTEGDALVNKGDASSAIADDTVVCYTAKPKDVDGASFTYQVKVDAGVADGALTNKLVHSVDNPGAKPATASHTVAIKGVATSRVGLAVTPDRIQTGESTTATAIVFSSKAAAPTGTVEFWAGTRLAGTGTLDATGKATATLSGFDAAGTIPVTARYLGDTANAAATSAPVNLVVGAVVKVRSKLDVDAPRTVKKGKKALVRVAVSAPKVVPTGTVEVTVKGALKKKTFTLTLNEYGKARLRLPKAKQPGTIKVTVSYLGDAAVLESKDSVKIKVVKK
ncbi:putative repeat protein (TIGR01451 family) [Nocardioides cavernae]|uniref:Putative repeat protein (TIGR01451 family) n=1 Tax=Nocardioides cavernae TaxID=1921566 RepID=A0A7Y9H1S7_9ACTN|nr:S8 family serine peptidase [Nocardioides cavernae]NYE36382.1 putative repeat protein (TIGR01451 family) [Nocardioides cavernae]